MTTCAFKMVLIFSDRDGCELAKGAAANLCGDFEEGDYTQTSWKTELLRSPKLRMLAAREAADADVVIVALREGSAPAEEINEWLDLWRSRRRRRRSTLMLLTQRASTDTARVLEEKLHAFAENAGMDFFCHSRVALKSCGAAVVEMLH